MIMTTTMTMATTTTRKTLSSPPASLLFLFLSIATNSHTATSFLTPPTVSIASRYQPSPPTTTAPTSTPRQITSLSLSGSDVSNLLYEEQEKLIVRRGELEESLVSNLAPLEAHVVKVRGTGNAGGFGGGKQNKNSGKNKTKNNNKLNNKISNSNIKTNNFQAEGKAHAQVLQTEGILRLDNVLPPDAADSLRDYVSSLRQTSEREVQSGLVPPLHRFADVLLKSNRCDLPLPLGQSPLLTSALHSLLLNSPVSSVIESLFGRNAVLHEFSCLVSDPGSQRQVLHPDTPYIDGKGPVLYTCFVALQDVTPEMGPTTWMPGTHTKEAHEAFGDAAGGKDEFLSKQRAVSGTLKKGDCAIFDSRVLHCGTANRSHLKGGEGMSRALFYFSFKNPEVGYTGNPASIRPEIGRAMLTLGDLMEDLEGWDGRDGSECTLIERVGKSLI